ncbi:MAG: hypothetical protein COB12_11655 [Flavobacterium sp.]|nr:MAG: hypothetical protein COB12_11655 [Flavobacterium sp.]
MKKIKITTIIILLFIGFTGVSQKYTNTENVNVSKKWNGNTFTSSKTFAENISEVQDFSQLKRALENKDLLNAIASEEMVTVFAVSNSGFEKYQEKQDSIFGVSNAKNLTAIIKYHIIPGRVDSYVIKNSIKKKGGVIYYATLQGDKLGIKEENGQLILIDAAGNKSVISATDFYHKNGFFHIVDGIVYPKL